MNSEPVDCSDKVYDALEDLKEQLLTAPSGEQIRDLSESINGLSVQFQVLSARIDETRQRIPIRVVYLLFLLVFGLVFGIEVVQHLITSGFI